MTAFHEVLFPLDISLKSAGGPQRRTDVVLLGSGAEERNARWAHSRRRYDAGYGVKTFEALSQVIAFFEERRGRLYGFRWRDRLDHSSAAPGHTIAPTDQVIGTGDGVTETFQLGKIYGAFYSPYRRPISKPVPDSVRIAVAENELEEGAGFIVDTTTGAINFLPGHIPASGAAIAAARAADPKILIAGICDERLRFLQALKTWPVFGAGWGRRVAEVKSTALKMAADAAKASTMARNK
ncbi:MAG: TIGR02217 family protein [Pseudolabrys sp.]